MKPSDECYELIREFEGLRLESYPDPATGGDPITCCYGHTGPEVKLGMKFTKAICDAYLVKDAEWASDAVNQFVKVPVKQQQFDALVSFVFNVGETAFSKSTLLRRINTGKPNASAEFLRWNKAAGKVMAGLTRRRIAERALFDS